MHGNVSRVCEEAKSRGLPNSNKYLQKPLKTTKQKRNEPDALCIQKKRVELIKARSKRRQKMKNKHASNGTLNIFNVK